MLNTLMMTRYLEAKQLLRHLRQCWNPWSSALQVHMPYKFLLYQFSHADTVPTPSFYIYKKTRNYISPPLSDETMMLTQF